MYVVMYACMYVCMHVCMYVRTPSATALPRCRRLVPPCYVPEGDSPLSLYATVLSSKVVLASVSRHRAGVRATVRRRKVYSKLTQ